MQRQATIIFFILLSTFLVLGQGSSSTVDIITVYSQNEKFYLKSIPFDNKFPTLSGTTSVYRVGSPDAVYTVDRGFDTVDDDSNNLILSNDGETIFFALAFMPDEEKDGRKSISIYKRGRLVRSYTASEITGCDLKRERCDLIYNNFHEVVDRRKSNLGSARYKKAYKDGVSEAEKFLSDFAIFSQGDHVYITDSKRNVHTFDLTDGGRTSTEKFDDVFGRLKAQGRLTRVDLQEFDAPIYLDFPKAKNGVRGDIALASFLGMKLLEVTDPKFTEFRRYGVEIAVTIARDGTAEIEELDADAGLPREKIIEFFKSTKFSIAEVPPAFPKWSVSEIFFLRRADVALARRERRAQIVVEREALKKRLVAETINGIYIPKDLGEALSQLDKQLSEINRTEMAAQPSREDMIRYHHSLGMWIRNNWSLWGGSRLQKYFSDKGITHPEGMSSVILVHYWDWLKGDKESWKAWERAPKEAF